jgi:biofilm PGA synthesis N-glycosyltransferase PgaC
MTSGGSVSIVIASQSSIATFKPREVRKSKDLEYIEMRIMEVSGTPLPSPVLYEGGTISPFQSFDSPITRASKAWFSFVEDRIKRIANARRGNLVSIHANIISIVPTYETEADIDLTIKSLLRQTRPIDLIVIVINGPGLSTVALDQARPYAQFPNVIIETPEGLEGKVNTLNWVYMKYIHYGKFDFVLGLDADIEADPDMVSHLETDIIRRKTAAGVMARYSFKIPEDMKGKSRMLVYGQRHEFAMTGIKHQLKKYTSEILGGQATLFRALALREAAAITEGQNPGPWDAKSKVEDAELTRTLQSIGYTTATSSNARAWTGLMFTPATMHKQRRKWQDGHLEDMLRDFRPWLDRRRWLEQFVLGWNLIIRVLFLTLLITSISLDKYSFDPIWLIPMGLAILQSVLVALKVPNRRFGEIVRSILFVPGEIYYMRTLSVWLDSISLAFINMKRDGWKNQALAEQSTKKTAHAAWMIIAMAIMVPAVAMQLLAKVLPSEAMNLTLQTMWSVLTIMTITSVISMVLMIVRIVRNYRRLQP